jgi:hypothetical protein
MMTLLNEFKSPDEPYRHWYFWNKSYKHFKKVHLIQQNLELHYKRFVLLDHFRWDERQNHAIEIFCHKLRAFKNQKIIHTEDIEDQIFCHVFWAL